ncbi:OmpA family protein [Tropicimonas sp. TH_r6]|uniref:OmpA family protein n=1 Tax=Tropicimonas sp. TH_r6 TaxID=3082085 RepID=UPI002953B84F|nr:OmpA family protein [Tropicimonas sp. TH_r6]MDV7141340.1 OmpA family protein [Tropicimonas sp. TH_r6]
MTGLPADSRLQAEQADPLSRLSLPAGPWTADGIETITVEGAVTRQAWQIAATGLTTLQILAPLREQLQSAGYVPIYDCAASTCGGFEFRYALDLLPEPAMHVDLGDFRYYLASRTGEIGSDLVSLLVSRASDRGFIHITQVGAAIEDGLLSPKAKTGDTSTSPRPRPRAEQGAAEPTKSEPPRAVLPGKLSEGLNGAGRAVLTDLTFETGSSRLADTTFSSLDELAAWLTAHPKARVVLVGHTDTKGGLEGNIALSRKRAASVRDRLRDQYGIALDRMEADGVGYLVPLVSNRTETGRTLNRRVEVVLASDE